MFLFGQECPSHKRLHAHHVEEIAGKAVSDNLLGIADASERVDRVAGYGHFLEDMILILPVGVVWRRDGHYIGVGLRLASPYHDQTAGVLVRERPKQYRAYDAEDRRISSYAEREGKDGDCRKARIIQQHSVTIVDVFQ